MQSKTLSNKEITQESYQATAREFSDNVANLAPEESMKTFIKLLPLNPKIIDIGCGSGRDAKILSNMGANVLGIDFCSNLIDIAKAHAPSAEFQLMDIETMNFPASSFDGAWAGCSLMHISKIAFPDVLKKIHFVLKENGYFYLTLKKGLGEVLENDMRYDGNIKKFWAYFEEQELKDFIEAAQFKILDFVVVEKNHSYQTHSAFRVFCQKF